MSRQTEKQSDTVILDRHEVKKPSLYKVIMHNDDYTTMEFVIFALQRFFQKDLKTAQQLMLDIHQKGSAICGIFSYEIAQTKQQQVITAAKEQGFPLRITIEEE